MADRAWHRVVSTWVGRALGRMGVVMLALCGAPFAAAQGGEPFRFEPLIYQDSGNGPSIAATPEASCKLFAERLGWHRAPVSDQLHPTEPGRWRASAT